MFATSTFLHVSNATGRPGPEANEATEEKRRSHPVYILRMSLNYEPFDIWERSGHRVDYRTLRRVELSMNKASTVNVAEGLSAALGITTDQLRALLAGRLMPEQARTLSQAIPNPPGLPPTRRRKPKTDLARVQPAGPSIAQLIAKHQGRWTLDDVVAAELAAASEGTFARGYEGLLDDVKSVRLARESAGRKASMELPLSDGSRGGGAGGSKKSKGRRD